jgi:hypothetical protein
VCGQVKTGPRGDYSFSLRAFDLAVDEQGVTRRIEAILDQQGDPARSRDDITFPIYAGVDCQGRSSVLLMAMNNTPGPDTAGWADEFIPQVADWVNPRTTVPKVLYVKDDNHQNEHPGDDALVIGYLESEFGAAQVDSAMEPGAGLTMADLADYDVVWFANPRFPLDDPASYDTLLAYRNAGGGLVIQGDDMAGPALSGNRSMSAFTLLDYIDNGLTTCNVTTNNNVGNNHTVRFRPEVHPTLVGLNNQSFLYGNDIDHTQTQVGLSDGLRILAEATFERFVGGQRVCSETYPAAVAIDPIELP